MKVTFSSTHSAFSVKAPAGTLVSLTGTPTEAVDGVYTIGDEGCINIDEQMLTKDIYLSISGSDYEVAAGARIAYPAEGVEVRAGSSVLPFKTGGKGGGGGSGGGCTYRGTTTTAISNGSTTNPIIIDGESYTAVFGDVVVYNYTEFVFDGTQWSEFGRPFDTVPTSGSANAVTSDGIYLNTAGMREFVNNTLKGEIFNVYSGSNKNVASGAGSHAEGQKTIASDDWAHAEGRETTASGKYSHAEGGYTIASGSYSHAGGIQTIASELAMTAIGARNSPQTGDLFEIGNGASSSARSNIVEVNTSRLNVNGNIQRDGVGIDDYTTTERKIGKWIDGSDLYQRTFEISDLAKNTWHTSLLGTTGIDIVDLQGFVEWYKVSDDTLSARQTLSYFDSTGERNEVFVDSTGADLKACFMYSGSVQKTNCKAVITIKYTKPSVQANIQQTEEPTEEPTDEMR